MRPAVWGWSAPGCAVLLSLDVIVVHPGRVGRLYDSLGAGVVGGVVASLAQLALLPNLGVWALAWMAGPRFGISGRVGVHLDDV